jgi:hypothetical protein
LFLHIEVEESVSIWNHGHCDELTPCWGQFVLPLQSLYWSILYHSQEPTCYDCKVACFLVNVTCVHNVLTLEIEALLCFESLFVLLGMMIHSIILLCILVSIIVTGWEEKGKVVDLVFFCEKRVDPWARSTICKV